MFFTKKREKLEPTIKIIEILRSNKISISKGYSEKFLSKVESDLGFKFPSDFRDLLLNVTYQGMTRWDDGHKEFRESQDFLLEGMLFDLENNDFWLEEFGTKFESLEKNKEIIKKYFSESPILIPIMGHRYLTSFPNDLNNPVYSVWQTDIIFYGDNLVDFFDRSYNKNYLLKDNVPKTKHIKLWSKMLELNYRNRGYSE